MSTALVTGANGFIGQHLTKALVSQDWKIKGLVHGDQTFSFVKEDSIQIIKADVSKENQLTGCASGIDTVFHLAAIPRNDLRKTWDDFYNVNVKGTESVLKEAQRAGVKRFVFISTVEAAGFSEPGKPRKESDPPTPVNNYGKSKLEAEKIVLNGSWNMECVVVRLPLIYGPGTMLIVPKLFGPPRKGFYPLIGNGLTKMEFCFVENAVHGIMLAGTHPNAAGEIFYVSDERSYTIREVISAIGNAWGVKVKFIQIPVALANAAGLTWEIAAKILPFPPIVSPFSRKAFFSRETVKWTTREINTVSIEKIKRVLGYVAPVSIGEGCGRTVGWLGKI